MASHTAIQRKREQHAAAMARTAEAFVPTPPALAEELTGFPYAMLDSLPRGARVLEPSAGDGALVRAILEANADLDVLAIEPDARRHNSLYAITGTSSHACTLESYAEANPGARFDAVVMNPPWALPGQPRAWIEHVLTAWEMLRPGGRLVAIAPKGLPGLNTKAGQPLAALIAEHGGTELYDVDKDAERAGFPSCISIVWLVRPIEPAGGRPSWIIQPTAGEPVTVDRGDFGPTGVERTPVQRYSDWSDGYRPRVARFAGTCAVCARLLWAHDDGREDASMHVVNNCLEAAEFGKTGPAVGMCIECDDADGRAIALAKAETVWTPVEPAAVSVPPINSGIVHRFVPKAAGVEGGPDYCIAPCHGHYSQPERQIDPPTAPSEGTSDPWSELLAVSVTA